MSTYPPELLVAFHDEVVAALPCLIERAGNAARKGTEKADRAFRSGKTVDEPASIKLQSGNCFLSRDFLHGYLVRYEASTSERMLAYLVCEILDFVAKKETRRNAAQAYAANATKDNLTESLKAVVGAVIKTRIAKSYDDEGGAAR